MIKTKTQRYDTTVLDARALADALEIEAHDCPAKAWSDGAQALTPEQFADAMRRIALIREAVTADVEGA